MRAQFLALAKKLKGGGSLPPLANTFKWVKAQEPTNEEYDFALRTIEEAYHLEPGETVEQRLDTQLSVKGYEDDFSPLLDEYDIQGWVRGYVEHTRGMEAPTPFHFGTALTILGAALRRRVYVSQGYYKIWPAMQTMLVGPSGKVKKSTAASYGVELGVSMGTDLFNVLPDEGSGEALKTELAQISKREGAATGLLYVSELGTFLGKQEYNVNLVQTLTDLFDSRVSKRRRTNARGNERMENIALSFLGCSNEDWLADAIPASAFGGGFFGRMLVYYQPDTDREFARPEVADEGDYDYLVSELERSRFVMGEGILTSQADSWFRKRYGEIKRDWPADERLVPFWERIPDHLLRMSMLLSISENLGQNGSIAITEKHLVQANAVLNWIVQYLPRVYSHLGGSRFGDDHARIYNYIRRSGGKIGEQELGRKMSRRMSRKQLDEHLETMRLNHIIERVKVDPWEGKYGWMIISPME